MSNTCSVRLRLSLVVFEEISFYFTVKSGWENRCTLSQNIIQGPSTSEEREMLIKNSDAGASLHYC